MRLTNFVHWFSLCYSITYDLELGEDLQKFLNCSLDDIYVVGDDNGEDESDKGCEGVTWYLGDYFAGHDLPNESDDYINLAERDGVRIAWTNDHGYTNYWIAKDSIANIPPIAGEDYAGPKRAFWENYRTSK